MSAPGTNVAEALAPPCILSINGGSSSIKFALYQTGELLKQGLFGKIDRIGYEHFSGYHLKIIQEVVTIIVFATTFLKVKLAWNYLVTFVFLGVAAFFAFAFKASAP